MLLSLKDYQAYSDATLEHNFESSDNIDHPLVG